MKAILCLMALCLTLNVDAKRASKRKKRISFKKIGEVVQNKDIDYSIDLKLAEPRVKLTQFCKSDTLPTSTDSHNQPYSNCLDDSRPASTERQRENGFMFQIQ
jgi:hypothetical protein